MTTRRTATTHHHARPSRTAARPPRRQSRAPVPGSAPSPLGTRDEARRETVPGRNLETLPADLRECARCMGPLPEGSTARRLYCCDACRVYASRDRSVTPGPQLALPLSVDPLVPLSHTTSARSGRPALPLAPLAAIAAAIATPADEYGPARAYCEVREGGYGVVFGRFGGRVNEPAGPVFPRPRQAIDLADLLNSRLAST